MQCSKLCSTGNIDGTGLMGMLVARMLELEESCDELVPWERKDMTRANWINELENLVFSWNAASPMVLGPVDNSSQLASPRPSMDMVGTPMSATSESSKGSKKRPSTGGSSDSKRTKTDDSAQASMTVSQAVAGLRRPLLDLEKRVFEITGLAIAAKDR